MKPSVHFVCSLGISGIFYFFTRSLLGALISFFSGILIDIDHFFDYFIYRKKINFDLKDFYAVSMEELPDRLYLFFHSIELVAIFWLLTILLKFNVYCLAFTIGITAHLLLDFINIKFIKKFHKFFYSFIFRFRNNFHTGFLTKNKRDG